MKYTDEQKQNILIRFQNGESISNIQMATGISRSTLYSWLKSYRTEITAAGEKVTPREFIQLKRRMNKLENIIRVLKTVNCTATSPLKEKLDALEVSQDQFEVHNTLRSVGCAQRHVL